MASVSQQSSFFSNLFGQRAGPEEPSESVLSEWNKYSAGSAGPSQSDKVMNQMEEGSANMQRYITSSLSKVTTGVQGISSGINAQASSFQMPSSTQLAYFAALLGSGVFFLVLAFTLFLPVIMLAPSKFALCFTLGSAMILSAFISLRGWRHQLKHMMSPDRLLFTLAYAGSMAGTLYAALGMHSYVLSLVFCGAQMVALLYYTLSYFPGGVHGLKYVLYSFKSAVMQCFLAVVGK